MALKEHTFEQIEKEILDKLPLQKDERLEKKQIWRKANIRKLLKDKIDNRSQAILSSFTL